MLSGWSGIQQGSHLWLPPEASATAPEVDGIFHFIFYVSAFFFLLIVTLMVVFVVRYRRREGRMEAEPSPTHNTPLEITWTAIPVVLVIVMFVWGFKVFLDVNTPPADAYEVQVTGQKWKWQFTYPNGHIDEDLHVPVDRPIELVMTSEDVIHGFYIPAFRLKRDVVPGRYAKIWFRATEVGQYQIYCTQYCGTGHSTMWAKAVVHPPGGFENWLASAETALKGMTPAQLGEHIYKTRGCAQCHTVTGQPATGPSFLGIWGHPVALEGGKTVTVDENYVRESILDPTAKVVKGFQPVMPTYKGRLKDRDITDVIAYFKTLAAKPKGSR
jgi:cytochrome c oxidase subunit II